MIIQIRSISIENSVTWYKNFKFGILPQKYHILEGFKSSYRSVFSTFQSNITLLLTVAQSSTNSTDSGVECSNGSAVECNGQDLESCGTRSVGGLVKESAERSIVELSNTCDSDTNVKVRGRWEADSSLSD